MSDPGQPSDAEAGPDALDARVDAMLDDLADELKGAVGCDDVFTYEWVRHGRSVRFAEVRPVGDPAFCAATRRIEGVSAFDYLSMTDRAASETWPGELWALDHATLVDQRAMADRGAHALHWAPGGITSTLGFEVTDQGTVIGGICAVRRGSAPPFERKSRDGVQRIEDALGAAFVAACRLRARLAAGPGARSTLVFDIDGALLGGSPRNAPWVGTRSAVRRLSALARDVAAAERPTRTAFVRRSPVRFERLVGRRALVIASTVEGTRYRPGTRERLTPTQRQVADLVSVGATIAEVARALGNRPSTVHHHLKGIYQRLGIGSRTELVRLLEPPPPPRGERRADATATRW